MESTSLFISQRKFYHLRHPLWLRERAAWGSGSKLDRMVLAPSFLFLCTVSHRHVTVGHLGLSAELGKVRYFQFVARIVNHTCLGEPVTLWLKAMAPVWNAA